ncbi:hypothetical protein I118_1128 [Bifidobacterium longum D2957]|nr:hypothetical protein I118_1128 [Bifidobacterium longum D2957]
MVVAAAPEADARARPGLVGTRPPLRARRPSRTVARRSPCAG